MQDQKRAAVRMPSQVVTFGRSANLRALARERHRNWAEVTHTMTWPGMDLWRPFVGLVAWLPRDHYNPADPHAGRPVVVIRVLSGERACIVVTRTSDPQTVNRGDIIHQIDAALGCDRQGWWQSKHVHRVLFSAFDDEDTRKFTKIDEDTLSRIIQAYEEQL